MTPRYLATNIFIASVLYIVLNSAAFLFFYSDTLTPWALPYEENFDQLERLDYRQFGGQWKVENGALVQSIENGTDLMSVIPLMLTPEQSYQFQSRINFVSGKYGGGLMFNLQDADNLRQSHMVRTGSTDDGQYYLVYGYFDDAAQFVSQGSIPLSNLAESEDLKLAVQVSEATYAVVLNEQAVTGNIPLIYKGGNPALTTWFSQVAFDDVSITLQTSAEDIVATAPTATPPQPSVQSLTYSDTFDSAANQPRWQAFAGDWAFESGAIVQTNARGFDYGMTFTEKLDQLNLRVYLRHREGIGGGVLFNMPQVNSNAGAHMVRYLKSNELIWGYYDEAGVFQGQSGMIVPEAGNDLHTLEIRADGQSYSIRLDGEAVANDIPLVSKSGYTGLTTSQSVVAFEQVDITSNLLTETPVLQAEESSAVWLREENRIIQQSSELNEYFSSAGIHGVIFEVSVNLTLPENPDAGAGLVFHTDDIASPAGGYGVRLTGNNHLLWGTFDNHSQFQVQGDMPIDITGVQKLGLRVRASDFDILLNEAIVATQIPLQKQNGWLFFYTLGGPVTFSDFTMNLTQIES